jgi:hypothetical protein
MRGTGRAGAVSPLLALTTLENESLIVRGSAALREQLGVFTKKRFNKSETIFSVKGPVMRAATRYSFSLDVDRHIDPVHEDGQFDFGHYLNHSCDPNTFIRIVDEQTSSHVDIVARRDIAENEELNFDYASLEYDTIAQVACECGTPLCRGKIHGFRELPEALKEAYRHEGMIPAYLLSL